MDPNSIAAYVTPLFAAALAGGLIGLEREIRGHPAGLRTHTLVSLTSALLMLAAVHQLGWLHPDTPREVLRIDPARMAHGILTGIGFLCGGVIFRQGLSVHGLTTAASLWAVSGIGILFGVGSFGLAFGGAAATLAILVVFRWVDGRLPQSNIIDVAVSYRRAGDFPEEDFRRVLGELGLRPQAVSHRLSQDDAIEIGATVRGPSGIATSRLAQVFCSDARVLRFHIEPRTD